MQQFPAEAADGGDVGGVISLVADATIPYNIYYSNYLDFPNEDIDG
jgi:hypothetical protein